MSTIGRAPKDYNAGAWGRIVSRIDKAINTLSNRLGAGEDATRQLQATQREQRATLTSMLTPEATFEWSEYVETGSKRVYGQCVIEVTRGWGIISDFEYREGDGNISSLTSWTSYKTGANMSFVPNSSYKGGGYYLYRKELPFIKGDDAVSLVSVELRGKSANGDVWIQSSHTFDANKVPQFKSEPKLVLQWDTGTTKWNVKAIGEADNDTLSVGFIVSDNTQLSESDGFVYTDFTTGVTNIATSDKRFNVSLGSFSPSTESAPRILYVAAAAFDAVGATPDNPDNEFSVVLLSVDIPLNPEFSGTIGAGDITGDMLADVIKIASINIIASHNSSTPSSVVDVSGTIEYRGDTSAGNPYAIGPQSITLDTTGVSQSTPNGPLTYIYFDPSISATDLQVAVATPTETAKQVATKVDGKRIFVGIGRAHFAERAFFVFADDQPVFSAPFIFASKLEALTGKMGTLYAGTANFKIGDEVSPDGLGGYNDGIFLNTDNYWYDTGSFKVGDANRSVSWDGTSLAIGIDGEVVMDEDGLRIKSGSNNVNKIRWVNAGGTTLAEMYSGGFSVLTISAGTNSIALQGSSIKLNKGVAVLADILNPASDAPGQAFFTTLYSVSGELYKRGGTGTAYQILSASNFPITGNNGDILYYNSGWQKLGAVTDGYVLTLAGGLPTWAASSGGGGSTTFIGLTDTPANYTGAAGQYVRVNSVSTGLEFVTAPSGTGTVTQINTGGGLTGGPITTTGTISIDFPTAEVSLFNFRALGIDSEQNYKYLDVSSVGADIVGGANAAAVKTTLSLDQVENQALSTWSGTSNIIYLGTVVTGTWSATNISLAKGGTGASLSDPNADRILFWDDSASTVTWLGANNGLSFNGTNLQLDWGSSVAGVAPYEVITRDSEQNIKVLDISGFGASLIDDADAAAGRTTLGLGSGVTGSFTETEFRNVGGGTGTEFRSRTNTLTNGIVTAQGAWGAWTEVLAI